MSSPTSRELQVGDRCIVGTKRGVVQYVGETKFAPGKWIGVGLDTAEARTMAACRASATSLANQTTACSSNSTWPNSTQQ